MAATITYAFPVSGTTAPTVAQAKAHNSVTATVAMADADTTAVITHNFQLTAGQLANLWPMVSLYQSASGTATATIQVVLTNSVAVTISKGNVGAGTGGTWTVTILRPHSMIT